MALSKFMANYPALPSTSIPRLVVSLRPDPADPEHTSIVKLSDRETLRIRGGHNDIAARLSRTTAAA